jgi:SAM-dependent methyltransferase
MANEFESSSPTKARVLAVKYEVRRHLKTFVRRFAHNRDLAPIDVKSRYSERDAKKIVINSNLAIVDGNQLSWFYTAFDRGGADPLTNFALGYIQTHVPKESRILLTGCGTGIMVFLLADMGFQRVEGRDYLERCIHVAKEIKEKYGYNGVQLSVEDGFAPKLEGQYDVITALHWVFSAWMGNYGNTPNRDPYAPAVREQLLTDLLTPYAPHVSIGGVIIIELTDAVADYRDPFDHPSGEQSRSIYPVRHTPEQVARCAEALGFEIAEKRLCVSYGHQPRTSYILRRVR